MNAGLRLITSMGWAGGRAPQSLVPKIVGTFSLANAGTGIPAAVIAVTAKPARSSSRRFKLVNVRLPRKTPDAPEASDQPLRRRRFHAGEAPRSPFRVFTGESESPVV